MSDKESQAAKIKYTVTVQDLRAIKSRANKYFYDMAKPLDFEGGDQLTLCYFLAVSDFFKIDSELVHDRGFQEPIE